MRKRAFERDWTASMKPVLEATFAEKASCTTTASP
jgi:hypothetical protein